MMMLMNSNFQWSMVINLILPLLYLQHSQAFFIGSPIQQSYYHRTPFRIKPWQTPPQTTKLNAASGQAVEAMQSMVDFHQGTWKGSARSFTISQDIAAGIIQRKRSPEYTVSVTLGTNSDKDYSLSEMFDVEGKVSTRSLSLSKCNFDVDSVDASYSLDTSLPDLPASICGTEKICQFVIEHCIAASNDRRFRCFIMYGADQMLQRIVVCDESRVKAKTTVNENGANQLATRSGLTMNDLIEMENDVDRLVNKIAGQIVTDPGQSPPSNNNNSVDAPSKSDKASSTPEVPSTSEDKLSRLEQSITDSEKNINDNETNNDDQKLYPRTMSLFELSSGVWLGDAIIRDFTPSSTTTSESNKRGFGTKPNAKPKKLSKNPKEFASWELGAQKVAWRLMWNFDEEIRLQVDSGKSLGGSLVNSLTQSFGGIVAVNESFSRRTPVQDRMVFLNWDSDLVGFVAGPVSLQVPRYLNFDGSSTKPFFTDFTLFQSNKVGDDNAVRPPLTMSLEVGDDDDNEAEIELPTVICSKMMRAYDSNGELQQGCSAFYTLKRFTGEAE